MRGLKIKFPKFRYPSMIAEALFFCLLPTLAAQTPAQVVTLVDSFKVRVRATPEISPDNILASLFKGTQLPLTGQEDGWYRVTLPDGQSGWVYSAYGKVEAPRDQLEVVYEVVRVRSQPTTDAESTARAIKGQRLHLLEKVDNWYKVEIPNETEGWVREDTVMRRPAVTAAPQTSDHLVAEESEPSPPTEEASPETSQKLEMPEAQISTRMEEQAERKPSAIPEARVVEGPEAVTEVKADWLTISVVSALLTVLVIAIFLILRRKRLKRINQAIEKGRSRPTELERTLVHEMKEAKNKRNGLDREVQGRLTHFSSAEGPSVKTAEDVLTALEELRLVIQDQQKRLNLYSELVSLQNEQIEAFKQENASIKKLLELKGRK